MSQGPYRPRRPAKAGLMLSLAAGAILLASATRNLQPAEPPQLPAAAIDTSLVHYVPEYQLRSGDELLLVLIGASFCQAHRKPGFPEAVEAAKVTLQRQAKARGWQFRAMGVSLDWKPKEALAFLDAFGEFDEISVGSNWINESALRYVWRDLPGDPVVPQLLVLKRRVDAGERTIRVTDEQILHRIRGSDEILAWVRSGAPI